MMENVTTPNPRHFTAFRSAAEEVYTLLVVREDCGEEGGHTYATAGYIMATPGAELPYKAVFNHHDRADTEQPCETISACRVLIARNTRATATRATWRNDEWSAL
jgi:hypothetical protein